MKTKNTQHHVGDYLHKLKESAGKISPKFNMEDIHHFRTTTKKMRSLLRLNGFENKRLPKKFLNLYHIAGELRNAQVLLVKLAKEGARLPGMFLWLATYIGKRERQWKKHRSAREMEQIDHTIAAADTARPSIQQLRTFFSNHIKEVYAIVSSASPTDEALHTTRKRIKDLVYVRQWCKDAWPEGWNATKKYSLLSLKKLGDVAGDYNDARVGMDLLALYLEQEEAIKHIKAAGRFEVRQRKDIANNKKILIDALQQYSSRFIQAKD
jgi:CHAD domain-containing protein